MAFHWLHQSWVSREILWGCLDFKFSITHHWVFIIHNPKYRRPHHKVLVWLCLLSDVSITQFYSFWVMRYQNWKHKLGVSENKEWSEMAFSIIFSNEWDPLFSVLYNHQLSFFFFFFFFFLSFFFSSHLLLCFFFSFFLLSFSVYLLLPTALFHTIPNPSAQPNKSHLSSFPHHNPIFKVNPLA